MAADLRKARAAKLAEEKTKQYGDKAAMTGRNVHKSQYYSSGSRTLDYMLGTGGFGDNTFTEVFGPPQIGKTTIYGFGILRSVQAAGGLTAVIATEPDFDEEWMEKHGVDPELNVIFRPDTGEQAWELVRDLVYDRSVDYFLWDSLAATSSEKEQNSEKPQAFGNAAMNSWGLRNLATKAWKNRVGGMFINQIRDDTKSRVGGVKSPGGHTIEHMMKIRIQAKPGKERYFVKVKDPVKGTQEFLVGREVRSVILKNKAAQQLGTTAAFDFYHIETDEYPFGMDVGSDLLNVAKLSGVITGSGWLAWDGFPDGKINGAAQAKEYVLSHPEAIKRLDKEVAAVMKEKESKASAEARSIKKQKEASA